MQINYEEIDKKANPGAFSVYDIEVLVPEIQKLKSGDVYLEVGVDRGRSLSIARKIAKKSVRVIGVDIQSDPKVPGTIFLQGDSLSVAKKYNGPLISVLFIDGEHSYVGCKSDIRAWIPKVKVGGVILFHDCDETSPGVMQAVAEYVNLNNKKVIEFKLFKRTDKNTSMALIRL